jgi:oligoribonuclease
MYLAIDIETTGLNPQRDQILEIAAVLDDRSQRVIDCPTFHCVMAHDRIEGSPGALAMNAGLIQKISEGEGSRLSSAFNKLHMFLLKHWEEGTKYIPVGNNVGSFDMQFLKEAVGFPTYMFHYRCLDINSLYANEDGVGNHKSIQKDVAERFDIPGKTHQALYDARLALALAREKFWSTR